MQVSTYAQAKEHQRRLEAFWIGRSRFLRFAIVRHEVNDRPLKGRDGMIYGLRSNMINGNPPFDAREVHLKRGDRVMDNGPRLVVGDVG